MLESKRCDDHEIHFKYEYSEILLILYYQYKNGKITYLEKKSFKGKKVKY